MKIIRWPSVNGVLISFHASESKSDVEAMVRALCTILGYTYETASSHVLRVWYSSPMGSVALTGSKRTSSRGAPPLGVQQYATFSTPTPQKATPETLRQQEILLSSPQEQAQPASPKGSQLGVARELWADAAKDEAEERRDFRDSEMVRALREISAAQAEMLKAHKGTRRPAGAEDSDHYNAVSRFEMKQNVPILKDTDMDLDKHLLELNSLLDCHSYGNQIIRPIDRLNIFRKSLVQGGTRQAMADIVMKRAHKQKRLPHEAKEVYEEVLAKLRKIMRE